MASTSIKIPQRWNSRDLIQFSRSLFTGILRRVVWVENTTACKEWFVHCNFQREREDNFCFQISRIRCILWGTICCRFCAKFVRRIRCCFTGLYFSFKTYCDYKKTNKRIRWDTVVIIFHYSKPIWAHADQMLRSLMQLLWLYFIDTFSWK